MSSPPENAGRSGTREGRFPSTRWTLIIGAGDSNSVLKHKAVSELCELYYHPVYVFAVRSGYRPQDAMDLCQGFFEFFLRTEAFAKANPERGRLRSFLLGSFKNFISSERRKDSAAKRGGKEEIVTLDRDESSNLQPADQRAESPAEAYDRSWALTLIDLTTKKLEREYSQSAKAPLFRELRDFLSGEQCSRSYAEAAAALGMKEGAARVAVYRMRQRFRELFREEVSETLEDPAHADEEIAHLKAALAS